MAGVIIWAADCVATISGGIQWFKVFLAIIVFIHSPCDHYAKLSATLASSSEIKVLASPSGREFLTLFLHWSKSYFARFSLLHFSVLQFCENSWLLPQFVVIYFSIFNNALGFAAILSLKSSMSLMAWVRYKLFWVLFSVRICIPKIPRTPNAMTIMAISDSSRVMPC